MKQHIAVAAVLTLISMSAYAAKPCEELKAEIAAKIEAKGVKTYQLEIVANDQVGDQKVVGSCEGGSKKITYKRGGGGTDTPAPAAEKSGT